jgi:SAM-dependent methyltransferase
MSSLKAKPNVAKESELHMLSPSPFVRRFGRELVESAGDLPILDVACGGGRNAAYLAHLGGHVICIDNELDRLKQRQRSSEFPIFQPAFAALETVQLDLIRDAWPFPKTSAGAIINIHFLHLPLLSRFAWSLSSGGLLLIETVEARGGNYLELPQPGAIRSLLEAEIDFLIYAEREIHRAGHHVATVKALGKKK